MREKTPLMVSLVCGAGFIMMACNLLAQTPQPSPAPTQTSIVSSPTSIFTPTYTPAPPTQTPLPSPTFLEPTPTPPSVLATYAVILVKEGDWLNVRQSPDPQARVVERLAPTARHVILSGQERRVGGERWVEVLLSDGRRGWVNAYFLTEQVDPADFCADARVKALLNSFKSSIIQQDGNTLARLISPTHGLFLQYLRGGTVAQYSPEEIGWVFQSTYVMNWGLHPASGLEVKGAFKDEVLPKLLDVLTADYEERCNNPALGGTTYQFMWPIEYKNINFVSLYRAGSPGIELDWRTWLVGIEYVGGEPYVFSLLHLMWEP